MTEGGDSQLRETIHVGAKHVVLSHAQSVVTWNIHQTSISLK